MSPEPEYDVELYAHVYFAHADLRRANRSPEQLAALHRRLVRQRVRYIMWRVLAKL